MQSPNQLIICNGYKDAEYIQMACLATKMGKTVIPVIEKFTEVALIIEQARRIGVRPTIGLRAKLSSRGSGKWHESGGERSKFGLTITETLRAIEVLREAGMLDCLRAPALPPGQPDHQHPPHPRGHGRGDAASSSS